MRSDSVVARRAVLQLTEDLFLDQLIDPSDQLNHQDFLLSDRVRVTLFSPLDTFLACSFSKFSLMPALKTYGGESAR